MVTYGELIEHPERMDELGEHDVLVGSATNDEELVRAGGRKRDSTMVFAHETIQMMKVERTEQLSKLKQAIDGSSAVVPICQKAESMWEYITVGRASTADILIDDPAISSVHAHFDIDFEDSAVCVQDVGSSNGTFVNRRQLQPHTPTPLRSGDCVRFGQSIFYFVTNSMLEEMVAG